MSTKSIVSTLKSGGEDFEWYPSTERMLSAVGSAIRTTDLDGGYSILDIGAGDGRTFGLIEKYSKGQNRWGQDNGQLREKYAIEKSQKLISLMPEDVVIVGTNFLEQSLLDKKVDVIFCNPPYSEFGDWAAKIILEGNAKHAYLIVPDRWKNSKGILAAIERRNATARVIYSDDFLDAERAARARVDVVHIEFSGHRDDSDPFNAWFEDHFRMADVSKPDSDYEAGQKKKEEIRALVAGKNPVETLAAMYRDELSRMMENYKMICGLDADILREIGVSSDGMKASMKSKIAGLKTLYWSELFSNLKGITDRLASSTRRKMLQSLNQNVSVDFTESNAYAIVLWAIKNANSYIDSQLLELYKKMTSENNAIPYKSNVHMTKDTWRYCRRGDETAANYKLDYRIVLSNYRAIASGYAYDGFNGLYNDAHDYIGDILTVASNLGFSVPHGSRERDWFAGEPQNFRTKDGEVLAVVKAFKNGNIHVKFSQKFMEAFNVEAGRLLGWVKSPADAEKEMGVAKARAEELFNKNFKFSGQKLLAEMAA